MPDREFDFRPQDDFDLHIALEVDADTLTQMFTKGQSAGIETRGVSDHGFIHSIYFRDPNGYVVELAAKVEGESASVDEQRRNAQAALAAWQSSKPIA